MTTDLREFWGRFPSGIEVCVAGTAADTLLGVRDAFRRFFHEGLGRTVPVAVVPQEIERPHSGLPLADDIAIALTRQEARALETRLPGTYHFYAASAGALHSIEVDGRLRWFVRNWTTVVGVAGEACGASGSVQIPDRLIEGLSEGELVSAIPGTRRSGGMIASLTGGLETRRNAVAISTLHALSTLFFGILESHPGLPR